MRRHELWWPTSKILTARPRPEEAASDAYAVRKRRSDRRIRLGKVLSGRDSLRDLFVLKELLDPPISLRSAGDQAGP